MPQSSNTSPQLEQLMLFEDLPSPALLRSELVSALLEHRYDDASRGLQDLLDSGHPDGPAFAAVLKALATLRGIQGRPDGGQGDADQAVSLMEGLIQQFRALVGEHVDSFARTLWAALASQFAHLPFSDDTFKAHAGWMHLQAQEPRLAWAAWAGVDAGRVSQEVVCALVFAGFGADGVETGWGPLCWYAWRWPETTRELIRRVGDADITALERMFTRECDLTMDWFPAWAMTQETGLSVFLRRAIGERGAEIHTSAQQCAIAVCDLVIAERGGWLVTEKRIRLQAMNAWVYSEYMQTVARRTR